MIASCTALSAFTVNAESDTQCKVSIGFADSEQTLEAYQVFAGDVTGTGANAKLTNITWGSGVNGDALLAALKSSFDCFADATSAEDIAATLDVDEDFSNDSDAMFKFSKIVAAHLTNAKTTTTEGDPENITVTGTGYYFFKDTSDAPSAYVLKEVNGDTTYSPKRDTPEIEKWIDGTNGDRDAADVKANNASKGDVIDYKLNSKVPNMIGYEKYYFVIEDTMESGLDFNNDIVITIGNTVVDAEKYDLDVTKNADNGTNFRIVFKDFLTNWKDNTGDAIEVQYSAILNKDATIGEDGNDNTVQLTYSNNPNISKDDLPGGDDPDKPEDPEDPDNPPPTHPSEVIGKTPKDKVSTYTAKLLVQKIDGAGDPLPGAEFLVEGNGIKALAVVTGCEYVEDENGTYYLKDGKYYAAPADFDGTKYSLQNIDAVTETETDGVYKLQAYVDADGVLAIDGLSAGTYTVKEVTAPNGYAISNDVYTAVLTWNGEAKPDDTNHVMWTGTLNDEEVTIEDGVLSFKVVNNKNAVLPGTGGIGTIVYYIVGSLLMAGAAVLFVVKRKNESEEG